MSNESLKSRVLAECERLWKNPDPSLPFAVIDRREFLTEKITGFGFLAGLTVFLELSYSNFEDHWTFKVASRLLCLPEEGKQQAALDVLDLFSMGRTYIKQSGDKTLLMAKVKVKPGAFVLSPDGEIYQVNQSTCIYYDEVVVGELPSPAMGTVKAWNSMDTAPRNGDCILIIDGDGDVNIASWGDQDKHGAPPKSGARAHHAWCIKGTWQDEHRGGYYTIGDPKGWIPLPSGWGFPDFTPAPSPQPLVDALKQAQFHFVAMDQLCASAIPDDDIEKEDAGVLLDKAINAIMAVLQDWEGKQ